MPELPEVETVARALKFGGRGSSSIIGERITRGELDWQKTLEYPTEQSFWKQTRGRKIMDVGRRGKYLILELDQGALIFHFRMSGDLLAMEQGSKPPPHSRLILNFESGRRLAFRNVRKFGRVWLVDAPEEVTGALGPEPFDSELDDIFHSMLTTRKRQIKPLLMDQAFLAGIGNIYADESLHLAKIHPLQPSNSVPVKDSSVLLSAIREVLNEAIERNGTSIDWMYAGGDYQEKLRVYKRDGSPCLFCGEEIKRIIVGQRGTHFCPQCQKLMD